MGQISRQQAALKASAEATVAQLRELLAPTGDVSTRRQAAREELRRQRVAQRQAAFDRLVAERAATRAEGAELEAVDQRADAEDAALAKMRRILSDGL